MSDFIKVLCKECGEYYPKGGTHECDVKPGESFEDEAPEDECKDDEGDSD